MIEGLNNKVSKAIKNTNDKSSEKLKKNKEIINKKTEKSKLGKQETKNNTEGKTSMDQKNLVDLLKDKIKTTERFIEMEKDYNSKRIQQYKSSNSDVTKEKHSNTYTSKEPEHVSNADVTATQSFIEAEKEYNKKIIENTKDNDPRKRKEKQDGSKLTKNNEKSHSNIGGSTRSETPIYPKTEKGKKVNSKRKELLKNSKSNKSNNETVDKNNSYNSYGPMLANSTIPIIKEESTANEIKNGRFSVYKPAQKNWKKASEMARSTAIEESNKKIEELQRIIPKKSKYRLSEFAEILMFTSQNVQCSLCYVYRAS